MVGIAMLVVKFRNIRLFVGYCLRGVGVLRRGRGGSGANSAIEIAG